jgi:hypothetical protein
MSSSFVCNLKTDFTRFPAANFAFLYGLFSSNFSKSNNSTSTGIYYKLISLNPFTELFLSLTCKALHLVLEKTRKCMGN